MSLFKRRRGNDSPTGAVQSVLPLRASLVAAVMGDPYAQKKDKTLPKAERKLRGLFPKEVILEARRLAEQEHHQTQGIQAILASKGHHVDAWQVGNWVRYTTHADLKLDGRRVSYLRVGELSNKQREAARALKVALDVAREEGVLDLLELRRPFSLLDMAQGVRRLVIEVEDLSPPSEAEIHGTQH